LQARQRFLDLLRGCFFSTPINLSHQERTLAIAVLLKGLTHSFFAGAFVVIPRVVEKIYPTVHTRVNQFDGIRFADAWPPEMKAAHTDARYFLACTSESSIGYSTISCLSTGPEARGS